MHHFFSVPGFENVCARSAPSLLKNIPRTEPEDRLALNFLSDTGQATIIGSLDVTKETSTTGSGRLIFYIRLGIYGVRAIISLGYTLQIGFHELRKRGLGMVGRGPLVTIPLGDGSRPLVLRGWRHAPMVTKPIRRSFFFAGLSQPILQKN